MYLCTCYAAWRQKNECKDSENDLQRQSESEGKGEGVAEEEVAAAAGLFNAVDTDVCTVKGKSWRFTA